MSLKPAKISETPEARMKSKRGKPGRKVNRQLDPRYIAAMQGAHEAEARLERRIAKQAEEPALGEAAGAVYAREQREALERDLAAAEEARQQAERLADVAPITTERRCPWGPLEGDGKDGYSIGDARKMIREGYHVAKVMATTGVGYRWLDDLGIGRDGRMMA